MKTSYGVRSPSDGLCMLLTCDMTRLIPSWSSALKCEKNGFAMEKSVDEKLDDDKPAQKKGVKGVIDKIFDMRQVERQANCKNAMKP